MTGQKKNSALNLLPLRVLTNGAIPALGSYLDICCSLARTLVQVHAAGVVHKGIQPDRVFICPTEMKSCFSISRPSGDSDDGSRESRNDVYRDSLIEDSGVTENLAYMAPEQMGRSDVPIDQRTDIYSLGVVLYELACLHLPYEENDVTAWIHAHLAKDIVPPTHYNEGLPRMVSSILMKCLKKDPADRYQSAYGLYSDLKSCFSLWKQSGVIPAFPLARQDVQDASRVFSELWERVEQLHQISELVPSGKPSQRKVSSSMALLFGESGTGKTTFLQKVVHSIADDYKFITIASCDSQPWTPRYGVVASALRDILRKLLGGSSEEHSIWSKRLQVGLAECSEFMLDVIPELALFLEANPVVNEQITPSQASDYFARLLEVLTAEGAVLICLDDLQWIDDITLQLLRHLAERKPANVAFILSLDRTQIDRQGHMYGWIAELQHREDIMSISLKSFNRMTIENILSRIFPTPETNMKPLADEIFQRTKGNPFLVHRWIVRLQQTNSIWFDIEESKWSWYLEPEREEMNAGVEDTWRRTSFLFDFDESTLAVLRWAAVVGRQFDVPLIAEVADYSCKEVEDAFSEAEKNHVITWEQRLWDEDSEGGTAGYHSRLYSFNHEQIQKEFLSELQEGKRQEMEHRVGLALLQRRVDPRDFPSAIFGIVNHLNAGTSSRVERKILIELNLWAGQQASYIGQYRLASTYFKTGLAWIGHLALEDNRAGIIFELRLGLANSRFMLGEMNTAETEYLMLLDMAWNPVQKAHIRLRLLRLYMTLGDFDKASTVYDSASFDDVRQLSLYGVPELEHENTAIAVGTEVAEGVDEVNRASVIHKGINSRRPLMSTASQLVLQGELKRANLLLATVVENDKFRLQSLFLAEPHFVYGALVAPWERTLTEAAQSLRIAREHAFTGQDLYLCVQIDLLSIAFQFASGQSISAVLSQLDEARAQYRTLRISNIESLFHACRSRYQSLMGHVLAADLQETDVFLESQSNTRNLGSTLNMWMSLLQLIREFILGDPTIAIQFAERLTVEIDASSVPFYGHPNVLLLCVILLADSCYQDMDSSQHGKRRKINNLVREFSTKSMKSEQRDFVLHFMHAEQARLKGAHHEAANLYEKASSGAEELHLKLYSAVANERCGDMVLEQGNKNYARALYTAAIDDYYAFGAASKAKRIEDEQSAVLRRGRGERRRRTGAEADTRSNGSIGQDMSQRIDWLMVSRAAQALSREVVLEQLLTRLMSLVLESAGAQRGFILLSREDGLYVEAFASVDDPHPVVLQGHPAADAWDELLLSVVDYTYRTTEDTLIDDATLHLPTQSDPYLPIGNPKSVLCTPMMSRQHVIGLLYLENNRMARAFTESRLDFMKVLAAQAAISIENAFLYESLEKKVAERTQELELSSAALAKANTQLEQANDELRQADDLRRELLANVSHDLRTPITLIAGYAEAIENGVAESPQQVKGFASRIQDKTVSITRLIEDLFNLVRLEAKQADFNLSPCTAEEFLVSMAMQFQGDVEQAGLKFSWQGVASDDITADGTWLLIDCDRMEQVFSNIIYNAIKHTSSGGTVELSLTKEPDKVHYHVHDTGSGIAPENLPHVFERFYKVDKSRSERAGGGLGLAIAKRIVDLHNGDIGVQSTLGEGTTFTITLGVLDEDDAPQLTMQSAVDESDG